MAGEAWLVVNAIAGGGRAAQKASAAARVLTDMGLGCRLVRPGSAAGTRTATRRAIDAGACVVVACGGDGTVHAVIQELAGTIVPLAILPSGSGDDIATSLGFSVGPTITTADRLAQAIRRGTWRAVDLGEVQASDGALEVFLAVLSTGFDSSVNERANGLARLGGQRYNVAMIRELASFRALPYRVVVDGVEHVGPGMLVSVGNGPRFGGGMLVCPDALLDDDQLDITWLGEISIPRFLGVFPRVYKGTHVTHPAVRTLRGRVMEIEAQGQVAYADGERIGPLPVSVSVRPRDLRVVDGWAQVTS